MFDMSDDFREHWISILISLINIFPFTTIRLQLRSEANNGLWSKNSLKYGIWPAISATATLKVLNALGSETR